jgi:fatty acid desaturase
MSAVPDLGALRAELRAAGVFESREARSWVKLMILLGGAIGSIVAIAHVPWWAIAPLVIVCAVFTTSAAMVGHEGSHKAFSRSSARNTVIQYLTFPLFSGLSALYWREKHDRLHHGHPNVQSKDPDIKPWPFVSCREDHERCGPLRRWFHRNFQGWAFWPMTPLMAVGMRRLSINYLITYPRKHGFDRGWWLDVACLAAHYMLWMVGPSLVWGPLVGIGIYASVWAVVGVLLVLIFAPAHIGLPLVEEQRHDWIHQLETTRNLQLPKPISWFFIGLDYQVEHHLFPKIPHQNLPRAAEITRAFCAKHGVVYLSEPYLAALADSTRFMHRAWRLSAAELAKIPSAQLLRQSG